MLIYILSEISNLDKDFIESNDIILFQEVEQYVLNYTNSLSMELLGLPLSELEINQYNNHYSTWKDFSTREDTTCLIIESIEFIINCKELIEKRDIEIENFEIILTYNPFSGKSKGFDMTYSYGLRMGVAAYFINKTTANVLIQHKIIELPVDEFFLKMSRKEMLLISFLENNLPYREPDNLFFNDRNENKLRTILTINNWKQNEKSIVIEMLRYLFEIAIKLNIPLFLSDGTLLAFIRHGEIMGWDDDIDISTEKLYIKEFISKIKEDNIYQVTERIWNKNIIYYKVWHEEGSIISGYDYTFPFIDIWLYSLYDDHLDFGYGEVLHHDTIFPLHNESFHKIPVMIPKDSQLYLDKTYSNWRTKIHIYEWNHKTERASNMPLEAIIKTSQTGRILLK